MVLISLFFSAFLAATLFPAQSELLFAYLVSTHAAPSVILLCIAGTGNTLGSCVNWYLGKKIRFFKDKPWFPASSKRLEQAENLYQKYGRWSLLLSWMPIIGDPITVIAGVLNERFKIFVLLVSLAKFGRYSIIWAGLIAAQATVS